MKEMYMSTLTQTQLRFQLILICVKWHICSIHLNVNPPSDSQVNVSDWFSFTWILLDFTADCAQSARVQILLDPINQNQLQVIKYLIRSIAAVKRFTQHQKSVLNKTNKYIILVIKLAKVRIANNQVFRNY